MVSFLEIIAQKLQKRVDMIDIKLLQNDFEKTSISLQKKGVSIEVLENLQTLAQNTKQKRQIMEEVTAEQNILSKEFPRYKKENLDVADLQQKINNLKNRKQELEDEVRVLEEELSSIVLGIPNLPDENVPFGADEDENVVLEVIGTKPTFDFKPKEHWEFRV